MKPEPATVIVEPPPHPRRGLVGRIVVVVLALLVVAAIAVGGTLLLRPELRLRMTPTVELVERIIDARGETGELWTELETRDLPAAQRDRLIDGLLAKRGRIGYLPPRDGDWLVAQLEGGGAGPDLERYYTEMLEARVLRPSQAIAGRPTALLIQFRDFQRARPDKRIFVVTEGVRTEGGTTLTDRATAPTDIKKLPRQRYRTDPFTPSEPGPLTVSIAFWHLYGDPAIADAEIAWDADGSLIAPPGADFVRRVELVHEIEVTGGGG